MRMFMKKIIRSNLQRYFKITKILYKQALLLLIASSKKVEKIVSEPNVFSKQLKNMHSIYVHNKNRKL